MCHATHQSFFPAAESLRNEPPDLVENVRTYKHGGKYGYFTLINHKLADHDGCWFPKISDARKRRKRAGAQGPSLCISAGDWRPVVGDWWTSESLQLVH